MKSLQLVNNEREMKGRRPRVIRKAMKRKWEGSVR